MSLGTPIMSEEWIFRCWDFCDDVGVSANDEHLVIKHLLLLLLSSFRLNLMFYIAVTGTVVFSHLV